MVKCPNISYVALKIRRFPQFSMQKQYFPRFREKIGNSAISRKNTEIREILRAAKTEVSIYIGLHNNIYIIMYYITMLNKNVSYYVKQKRLAHCKILS